MDFMSILRFDRSASTSGANRPKSWLTCLEISTPDVSELKSPREKASASRTGNMTLLGFRAKCVGSGSHQ